MLYHVSFQALGEIVLPYFHLRLRGSLHPHPPFIAFFYNKFMIGKWALYMDMHTFLDIKLIVFISGLIFIILSLDT